MEKIRQYIRSYLTDLYEIPLSKFFLYLKLTPSIITFLGFIITCVGSYFVFNGNFLFGGIIIGIGIFFDSIDGTMARISGKDGDFGNLLDSVIDRFGEGVIYLSIIGFFLYKEVNKTAVILCSIALLFSFMISLCFLINFLIVSLVMPLRISVFEGWVINILFFTIQTLELVASVTFPLSINIAS